MENHPIPQDITGFKFKLIGSITVKQFMYLLGGGVIAAIIFFLIFPKSSLVIFLGIKLPLSMLFAGTGAALAFLPVDGRPLDKMIINFIRTIPSENMYIYRRQGVNLASYEIFKPIQKAIAQPAQTAPSQTNSSMASFKLRSASLKPDDEELAYLSNIKSLYASTAKNTTQAENAQNASFQPVPLGHAQKTQEKTQPIRINPPLHDNSTSIPPFSSAPAPEHPQAEETNAPQSPTAAVPAPPPSAQSPLKTESAHAQTPSPNIASPPAQTTSASKVNVVSSASQLLAGFPSLPDIPNIVLGIIKDARGKVLPSILVEVVDAQEIPVRTFKTNKLGQFIAATPLPNGTYKIFLEDPQRIHEFDTVVITLTGEIFQPLEIISVDQREKLRRELFGSA